MSIGYPDCAEYYCIYVQITVTGDRMTRKYQSNVTFIPTIYSNHINFLLLLRSENAQFQD